MIKQVSVTLSMPARVHAKLRRRAAGGGPSVEAAILQCVMRHEMFFDQPKATVSMVVQPGQLWAHKWSNRWGELGLPDGRASQAT